MLSPCVVITGACGGIGISLIRKYLSNNYFVIAIDKNSLVMEHENPQLTFLKFDISTITGDESNRQRLKDLIEEKLENRNLVALINNAAIQIVREVSTITEEDWLRTLKVNLLAPFFLSQMLIDQLASSKGSVLNISSIHARQSKSGFLVYATSKAALSSLTRMMALELGSIVRFNAIEPGAISTQMLESGFANDPEKRKALNSLQPMLRIGTPDEVAELAFFMTSSGAKFMNGATVEIDGGIGNRLHDPL